MAEISIQDIVKPENLVYEKAKVLTDNVMHYCPGCTHGVIHKLIAEVIDEMGIQEDTIGVSPVGCSVLAYNYLDIDWLQAAHGRAPALATAAKRLTQKSTCLPTKVTVTLPRLVLQKLCTPATVERTSW